MHTLYIMYHILLRNSNINSNTCKSSYVYGNVTQLQHQYKCVNKYNNKYMHSIICIRYGSITQTNISIHVLHCMDYVLLHNSNINNNMLTHTKSIPAIQIVYHVRMHNYNIHNNTLTNANSIHACHIMYPGLSHSSNININTCMAYYVPGNAQQRKHQY